MDSVRPNLYGDIDMVARDCNKDTIIFLTSREHDSHTINGRYELSRDEAERLCKTIHSLLNHDSEKAQSKTLESTDRRPIPDASIAVQAAAQNVQAAAGKAYEMLGEVQNGWLWKLLTAKGDGKPTYTPGPGQRHPDDVGTGF